MHRSIIILIIILLWGSVTGLAYERNDPGYILPEENLQPVLEKVSQTHGQLQLFKGEIISVHEKNIVFRVNSENVSLDYKTDVLVWVNGRRGRLEALRPVTEECFFSARVWIDQNKQVCIVDGYYRGAEVEILEVAPMKENRYRMMVQAIGTEEPIYPVYTTVTCQGVQDRKWESLQGAAYILFDMDGYVKGIFQ